MFQQYCRLPAVCGGTDTGPARRGADEWECLRFREWLMLRNAVNLEPSSSLLSGGSAACGCACFGIRCVLCLMAGRPEKVKLNYVSTRPAWRQMEEMLCGVLFSIKFQFTVTVSDGLPNRLAQPSET